MRDGLRPELLIDMAANRRRSLVPLVVLLLILAGVATWRVVTTRAAADEAGDKVHAQLKQIISQHPVYGEHGQYLDGLLLSAHQQTFDEHYRVGFLVRPQFDHSRYVNDVFALMVDEARVDDEDHVAVELQAIGEHIEVNPP